VKLESLLPQNTKALPPLAHNSDDDDGKLPGEAIVKVSQVGRSCSFEDGGGNSGDGDLFLDLDKSDDDLPTTAAKKRKKKNKRKKKITATVPPSLEKSQEDLDTMAELDRWLSKGAPLSSRKTALRTDLLIRAAKVGHMEAVKMLLGKPGIRVLLELPLGPDNMMSSALHIAVLNGHSGVVRLLLAKPDTQINRAVADGGYTPLHIASENGHSEVVKILLNAGADIEATTPKGPTSLYIASQQGHAEVVNVLLDAGADKEATTQQGYTSLYIASHMGHAEVVKILLDARADIRAITPGGHTSLHIASHMGHSEGSGSNSTRC
jgi:ankyrin repeat protein